MKQPDPILMLEQMSEAVFAGWLERDLLKDPDYRSEKEADLMDEDDVAQAQADIIRRMIPGFPGDEASA